MLPDNYTCRCGVKNWFSSFVYANWEFTLGTFCENCGRMNRIFEGEVLSDEKEETAETQEPPRKNVKGAYHASKKSPIKKKVRPEEGKG